MADTPVAPESQQAVLAPLAKSVVASAFGASFATEVWALAPGTTPLLHCHSTFGNRQSALAEFPHPGPGTGPTQEGENLDQYEMLPNGTAVISVCGVMMKSRPWWSDPEDGEICSCEEIHEALKAALEDARVTRILLSIESPGGNASGAFELAESILEAREMKPVHAYVCDMACSGAYLLASQCQSIGANAPAQVGSIGCYLTVLDYSKAY